MNVSPTAVPEPSQPVSSLPDESLINARLVLVGPLWRPAAAWMLLAGFVASSGLAIRQPSLLPLLFALLLADPLWGALWAQTVRRPAPPRQDHLRRGWLPYAQPSALGGGQGPAAALVREGLPPLAAAAVVAAAVGPAAVWATALVVVFCALGGLASRAAILPVVAWLRVLVGVALPFGLGVALAGGWFGWPVSAQLVAVGLGVTLMAGAGHAPMDREPYPLLWGGLGAAVLVAAFLLAGQAVLAGVVGLLTAGPLLQLAHPQRARPKTLSAWLWVTAMVAALALGLLNTM